MSRGSERPWRYATSSTSAVTDLAMLVESAADKEVDLLIEEYLDQLSRPLADAFARARGRRYSRRGASTWARVEWEA